MKRPFALLCPFLLFLLPCVLKADPRDAKPVPASIIIYVPVQNGKLDRREVEGTLYNHMPTALSTFTSVVAESALPLLFQRSRLYFPKGTKLTHFPNITDDDVMQVSLSREFLRPGFWNSKRRTLLAVYAIVNTAVEGYGLPDNPLRVKLLIEGKSIRNLANIDLRKPLRPRLDLLTKRSKAALRRPIKETHRALRRSAPVRLASSNLFHCAQASTGGGRRSHRVHSPILGQWRGVNTMSDGTRIEDVLDYRTDGTLSFRALVWFKGRSKPSRQWGSQTYILKGSRISQMSRNIFVDGQDATPSYMPKAYISLWSIRNGTLRLQELGERTPLIYRRVDTGTTQLESNRPNTNSNEEPITKP